MDDVTKKTIEELVLNFISEMNEWEKFCNNLKKENTQLSWNEKQDMMKQKVASIFIKYCTNKERKMYGHEIEMYTVEQGEKRDKRQ